jgi:hypothetical protein
MHFPFTWQCGQIMSLLYKKLNIKAPFRLGFFEAQISYPLKETQSQTCVILSQKA